MERNTVDHASALCDFAQNVPKHSRLFLSGFLEGKENIFFD
jgi:hypothetical protein